MTASDAGALAPRSGGAWPTPRRTAHPFGDGAPPAAPKRVVIVDDSPTMRAVIAKVLDAHPGLQVVGTAADPFEAREVIKATAPDVVTLDIEMPKMDGLAFLEKIMRLRPMPVVMLSSATHAGSQKAVEALSLGAVDAVGKPAAVDAASFTALAERVWVAASARVQARSDGPRTAAAHSVGTPTPAHGGDTGYRWDGKAVLIGASTGGVDALERVLGALPVDAPPILITQHMPTSFLESVAHRLDGLVAPSVALATEGAALRQGSVLIAPGGETHLCVDGNARSGICRLVAGPRHSGHRPSVDRLFLSAAGPLASQFVGVLLTGMGRDGAEGLAALRKAGAHTIAQDAATSVVYGMPRAAAELGAVVDVVPLERVARTILNNTGRLAADGGRR